MKLWPGLYISRHERSDREIGYDSTFNFGEIFYDAGNLKNDSARAWPATRDPPGRWQMTILERNGPVHDHYGRDSGERIHIDLIINEAGDVPTQEGL